MSVENAFALSREDRGDTKPMKVANMTFLINRLGEDCAPLQFVRELTQNGLDAIRLLDKPGEVIWDVDWAYHELSGGVMKLACIDTGTGMTGPDMVRYINELSSSVHQQSTSGNFGVGAKIAAVPLNPHGLVYMSWLNGVGHMIHLWLDPDEQVYGLKRWPQNGGEFWTPVSNELKPKEIGEHGTMVVLLGHTDDENTTEPPSGTPMKSRWLLRYLNTRYFRFPKGVEVKAREGLNYPRSDSRHNFLRVVEGQGAWLDKNAESRGTVALSDATAHWWILKEDVDRDSGHTAPGGHTAALFQDELYEMAVGRAGIARLQSFGVIFGTDRVVVYVEPESSDAAPVTANTARTQLMISGESLDWSGWSAEFRESMPDELSDLQEKIGARAGEKDHRKAISERLRQIKDLLRFARYRPAQNGSTSIDPDTAALGGEAAMLGGSVRDGQRDAGKSKGGRAGDIYALYAESGPTSANPVAGFDEPQVHWQTIEDGTRNPNDMKDRAAKYLLQQNLILVNADFRVFTDMVERWSFAYAHVPGAISTVKEVVHEWFQQQLVETVMSARALKSTGRFSMDELQEMWSEAALTAAVLPRWHIDQSIKRQLGFRLGSLKQAA
jgi:hypothetical protein